MSIDAATEKRLSSLLLAGNVNEEGLRDIMSLKKTDIPRDLIRDMLMVLADTDDVKLRNILAITLADSGINDAASSIVHLVTETKTVGSRGTLLYALHKLNANLDLYTLINLILRDTPEAKEEALVLMEDLLAGGGVPLVQIEGAIRTILRSYPYPYLTPPIVKDAKEFLEETLVAAAPQ